MKKIKLVQIAYKSEWALAKFFQALKDPEISEKYELTAICGRELTKEKTLDCLEKAIEERVKLLASGKFRADNREKEIQSSLSLMKQLASDKIKYYNVNGNQTLSPEIYKNEFDALIIHSKNTSHLGYISDGIIHNKHILCEKPIVTLLDPRGRPKINDLEELEKITSNNESQILMDAEHYSYKKPSLIFYENLDSLLESKKIKKITGVLKEIDDPNFGRTKDILQVQNETGLLTDTGIHLLAFISNLEGYAQPKSFKYARYPNYDAETFGEAEYEIKSNEKYFLQNATANIQIAKFIDKFKKSETKEEKYLKFELEDNSEVMINFKEGTVKKSGKELSYRYNINSNEYVNILNHFYEGIINKKNPLTDFKKAQKTLRTIYETYKKYLNQENICEVYNDN